MTSSIFAQVDQYIAGLLAPEDDALQQAEQAMLDGGLPSIQVSPNQGKFLQLLALMVNARRILEIGTLGGYSTIWMARALPAEGHLLSLELEPDYAAVARQSLDRAGLTDKVTVRVGPAMDTLASLVAEGVEPFDFIFIDADKPPYAEYFEWAVRLSRPGTLIVADNVIREGAILDPNHADDRVQGVRRLNQLLAERTDVTATILQLVGVKDHDGMALAVVNRFNQ